MSSSATKGFTCAVISVVAAALDGVLLRALQVQPNSEWMQILVLKSLLSGIVLWTFDVAAFGVCSIHRQALTAWRYTAVGAACGVFFAFCAYATLLSTSTEVLFLTYTGPSFAAVFGWVMLDERPPCHTLLCLVVTLGCLAAIFPLSKSAAAQTFQHGDVSKTAHASNLIGDIFALLAGVALGVYLVASRHASKTGVNPDPTTLGSSIGYVLVGLVLMIVALSLRQFGALTPMALLLHVLEALCTGVYIRFGGLASKFLPAASVGLVTQFDMCIAPVLVFAVYHELPATSTLIIAAIVFVTLVAHGVWDVIVRSQEEGRGGKAKHEQSGEDEKTPLLPCVCARGKDEAGKV
jgi:drug/metabolite transporter (DMT)-like permease